MPIRVLTPQEAARIAAGEVIERPASVAKELIENALDADARQVTVEARRGGITFLRVADDGAGIPPDELPLAFERHATSKLQTEDELARITTLGFRGEALPSIAAAADVDLVSRPEGALVAGRLVVRNGEIERQGSAGAPPGTQVTVQRLFERQPARLKFLRSPAAEAAQIATVVTQYALAYPEVRFAFRNDGKSLLQTPGNGDLRDAATAVYGVTVAAELLEPANGRGGPIEILGLIGSPAVSRANRNYLSLFVNRRWIRHRALTFALTEAYQGMLPRGRFPIAIVEVRLPPDEVDVNVHPTKAEVRFRDERAVFAAVQRTVRATLSARSPIPDFGGGAEGGVRAFSAPDEGWPAQPPSAVAAPAATKLSPARSFEPEAATSEPRAPAAQRPMLDQLPLLRAVGQVSNMYVIAEGPDGLYLVDQHAAHERVLYDRFVAQRREGAADVQPLLQPVTLELTAQQRSLLDGLGDELRAMGLAVEPFGDGAFLVRAVPAALTGRDAAKAVPELLDILSRDGATGGDGARRPDEAAHRVAASLACHAAVRAGDTMTAEEQRELLTALEATDQPRTCPHGRPTMVHLSSEALARQFGRR